jgi:hypothetical protein
MRALLLKAAVGLLAGSWLAGTAFGIPAAHAQGAASLHGPVTALYLEGNRLWIGQGPMLVEAIVTADNVYPVAALDVGHHDLRAITSWRGITFVLSEDGLTTLDGQHKVLDYAEGGGQRMLVQGGRVFVAALNAGVRVLKVDTSGRLTRLGFLPTLGPANDLVVQGDHGLWVAEGTAGVRLYDTRSLPTPEVLASLDGLAPAALVRSSGSRLYVGHANRLTVLDTSDVQTTRVLGSIALDGADAHHAHIADLLVQGSRVYLGRLGTDGADILSVDLSDLAAIRPIAAFGSDGAGERLALFGDDLLIGSGRFGLRRVRFGGASPVQVAAWEPVAQSTPCLLVPTDPQPPNLSTVPGGPVTLHWAMGCDPAAVQVQINGTPVAPLDGFSYRFVPHTALTTWQVTVLDAAGRRFDGPHWTFESAADGWLATPVRPPNGSLLYTPPALLIDSHSPGFAGLVLCAALGIGLSVMIGAVWLLGSLSQRRRLPRQR